MKLKTRKIKHSTGTATIKENVGEIKGLKGAQLKKYVKDAQDILSGKKEGFVAIMTSENKKGNNKIEGVIMAEGISKKHAVKAIMLSLQVNPMELLIENMFNK